MMTGATIAHWSVILGQQGSLGAALDSGLEITAATADDFLTAQAQLMAGLEESGTSPEELRTLAQAAIQLREVVSGERVSKRGVVVTYRDDRIRSVLKRLDTGLRSIDPARFSQGVAKAKENYGFGLAAGARLFASREAAQQAVRETFRTSPKVLPRTITASLSFQDILEDLKLYAPDVYRLSAHERVHYTDRVTLANLLADDVRNLYESNDFRLADQVLTYLIRMIFIPCFLREVEILAKQDPEPFGEEHVAMLLSAKGPRGYLDKLIKTLRSAHPDLFEKK